MDFTHRRAWRAVWSLLTAAAISAAVTVAGVAAPASAAAPAVEPVDGARAGEIVVFEVRPSSVGQLTVTAPPGSAVAAVYNAPGCAGQGTTTVTCGTESTAWARLFYVAYRISVSAPAGPLTGGSIAFSAGGSVVDSAAVPVTILPPWSVDSERGAAVVVPIGINGGYSGALSFTAPSGTRITGIADTPCTVSEDGRRADCGADQNWQGTKNVSLQVGADAPFGSLPVGALQISTVAGLSSTPYTVRILPSPPTVEQASATAAEVVLVTGTGVPGATVEVRRGADLLGTAVAVDDRWRLTVPAAPGDVLTVRQRIADATSTDAATEVALPTPTVIVPAPSSTVASGSTVSGAAYPRATVSVVFDDDVAVTTTASSSAWAMRLPASLAAGRHRLTVNATINGVSSASSTVGFSVEAEVTTPPPVDPTPNPTASPTPPSGVSPVDTAGATPVAETGSRAPDGELAFTGVPDGFVTRGFAAAIALVGGGLLTYKLRRRRRY